MNQHVMIIGAGRLGFGVLNMLIQRPDSPRITVVGPNLESTRRRVNLALLTATQLGFDPDITVEQVDLKDVDRTSAVIAAANPDLIFNTASLQAWWVISELPADVFAELDAADIGPWLPMQLTLIHKLMRAVRGSGRGPRVLNAALPDVTHAMLGPAGLAPTIGVGNVANVVPGLRRAAADLLDRPLRDVDLRLVAEAFVTHTMKNTPDVKGAPYLLRVLLDGHEVEDFDVDAAVRLLSSRYARVGGSNGTLLTAASAMTVIDAILGDTGAIMHAPGPQALIGGYPVRVWRDRVELALPPSVDVEHAKRVNAEAVVFDGIAEVRADGTAVYTPENMSILKRMLGYEATTVTLDESEGQAEELARAYAAFRAQHGVAR